MQRALMCVAAIALAIPLTACRENPPATATAERQTATPPQPANQPTTVIGCLRPGMASDTFVLTAEASSPSQVITYNLAGRPGVDFKSHIGRRVEVSGVIEQTQQVASQSGTQPAEPARGTTGTPAVSTTTKLDVRQLAVTGIRPMEGRCQ